MNKPDFIPAATFHGKVRKVYFGTYEWAVNKKNEQMAHVLYESVHENTQYQDERRGRGKDYAVWIFSEEEGLKEGIFSSGLELIIDATLEPGACIGLHQH